MKEKLIIIWVIAIFLGYWFFPSNQMEEPTIHQQPVITSYEVMVEGAVAFPGTYTFYAPKRIDEVIGIAGGLLRQADSSQLIYNQLITKNSTLTIPFLGAEQVVSTEKLNINAATFYELLNVPHITERIASYIIMYRNTHGAFRSLDDLIHVKYIGTATLEKIKPYLKVN